MSTSGIQLPGYEIGAVLYRVGARVAYRGVRLADAAAVDIVTLDAAYPHPKQVAELKRDGAIARKLSDIEGVLRVDALLLHGRGNLALVCEPMPSSLQQRVDAAQGQGLALDDVLDIASRLAGTLGAIHARDIVHKALMPGHVLCDPDKCAIRLTGFGIASELEQERQGGQLTQHLEGPLPYISPEQTGRMSRDLDYRSDYYSLGVILYELLTGRHPFEASTVLEWVHSHICRLPPPPHELSPQVPEAVSGIVLKLMSKSPEARYQTANGLIHDLQRCRHALHSTGQIRPFALGERDLADRFFLPHTLYGRRQELEQLFGLFESVVRGGLELCLVHGAPGVGKSSLVNEIDKPSVRERGFLVQGKFQQFQHGDTYTVLATALRGLVQQLLAEPEERLAQWRERLHHALKSNARLVTDLVPELELVIGQPPEVIELPPVEARNRLHIVLTNFLRVFAGEGHPVVLFLDDLQWCDAPTLEFLQRLVTARELSHLLVIGAYRSNEIGAGHPLRLWLDDLHGQINVRDLRLGPLGPESVARLVADALNREPDEVAALSDMLHDKAQGNPFFTNELLRQLHKEGAITRDNGSRKWNWDLDAVRWSGVSNDVVEFMVENLRRLEPATQRVLQLAACIGGTFDLQTLSAVYQHPLTETAAVLLPALRQQTIVPLHSDYRLVADSAEPAGFNPSYRFQHDRVQQAAYALIAAQRTSEVHLFVGRLMLRHVGDAVPDDRLIDIVTHLNAGRPLIESGDERLRLAHLNLRAGIRAKRSAAYESALDYLRTAASLLPADPWCQMPELMHTLARESQQCAYLTGRAEEAERWTEQMLERAQTDLERSDILATRTRQYATLGRMEESILSAMQGLLLLGVELTQHPSADDIAVERRRVEENLRGRRIADLVDAPPVEDAETLMAMRLFMETFAAAFLSGSGNLFPYLVLKAVNLSLRHGNCPESAFAYAAYGMLLCGELDDPAAGYQYGKVGLAINERLDDIALRARVIYVYAMFIHHWSNAWSSLTPWFRKGIEAGYQTGDLLYLAYSAQDCVIWDPTLDLETAYRRHAKNMEIVRECAYQDSLDSGTLFLQLQRNLLGLTDSPFSLGDDEFDEQVCLAGMRQRQFMTGISNYHIYSTEICLLYNAYDRALEHVRMQDALVKSAMSLPQLVRYAIVSFLTLSSCFAQLPENDQPAVRRRLERDLAQMTRWADNCAQNFRHLQYLMEAELDRLDGARESALESYDRAINAARDSGFLHDEATASERAARHLIALGRERAAEGYLRGTHHLYTRWGARRKAAMMENEFPFLREMLHGARATIAGNGETWDLDLASVMKASRVISGEIVLSRLLKTSIEILLENAGGEWGCLVARREGMLTVEASVTPPNNDRCGDNVPRSAWVTLTQGGELALPVTLISHVLRTGEALVLHDATREGPFSHDPYIVECRPASVLCVPLRRERFEGVLYMENNLAGGVFTGERVEVIRLLAAQAAVAIENARLYEEVQDYSKTLEDKVVERTARLEQLNQALKGLAERDGLTGVANRHRGDTYLEEVWARLRREEHALSIIMLDVDHFKAFNDNYGHQAGDSCLIAVAQALETQMRRPADMAVRFGGEEFMLILPDTDQEGALYVANKVCGAIQALQIPHAHSTAADVVTVSVGAATVVPATTAGAEQLIRDADTALYRAKRMGRNQVQQASAERN